MSIRDRRALARTDDLTTGNLLERFAVVRGPRLLAREPGGFSITYAAGADLVARAAAGLRDRVQPGERVLVATPNGYQLLLAMLAVGRVGGVAVPVNPRMSEDEIAYVEADAGATVRIDDLDALLAPTGASGVDVDPRSVAVLFYTSGTTGRPKGAELTHRALVGRAGAGALAPERMLQRGCVSGMPVAHIAGFTMLVQLLSIGIPVYLLPKFRPTDALDAIERERPFMFVGVPAMYQMMLEAGAEQRDLSSVRVWSSGADALRDEVADAFQRMGATVGLPGGRTVGKATFIDGYGMVELGGGAALRVHAPVKLPVSGLRPMAGARFAVVDDAGHPVPKGEVGELAVKGPGVMRGYHGRDDATKESMTPDGYLRTGDLARARPLGFFELAGRKKDVIKHGGYSVFAVEVERAIAEHPAVAEAAVVGLPDERKGEVPAAAVRLLPGASATPDEIVAFCASKLSDYKRPTKVVVVDDFPRTGTDKVQKRDLLPLFA
jgi:acyl-CoA synthetase (AMP-forming)/AMP-acid ligase II